MNDSGPAQGALDRRERAALLAMPTDGFDLRVRVLERLRGRGLAEVHPDGDLWVLTAAGRRLRRSLPEAARRPAAEAPPPAGGAERPALSPDLDGLDRLRITAALRSGAPSPAPVPEPPAARPLRPLLSARTAVRLTALLVLSGLLLMAAAPPIGVLVLAGSAVPVGVSAAVRFRRLRRGTGGRPEPGPHGRSADGSAELHRYRGRIIGPAGLGPAEADLLRRCIHAVDAVLGSSLHRDGLLLDAARNRAVLEDLEWSVAQSLQRHARIRAEIAALTDGGRRPDPGADRARAELEADAGRVRARVERIGGYARAVLAAEGPGAGDHRTARLDGLAHDLAASGAAHRHDQEALNDLAEAQRSALSLEADAGPAHE
ncbi:hypothetical protein [Nocardiopsis coralliicola]